MVRFIRERVLAESHPDTGSPLSFTWKGEELKIQEVVKTWKDSTVRQIARPKYGAKSRDWWHGGDKVYYRVRTEDGKLFDLLFDAQNSQWTIEKQLDQ